MNTFQDIKITHVIEEGLAAFPDGEPPKSLYPVSFALSQNPPAEWRTMFLHNWKRPGSYSSRHYMPDNASISGDRIILDKTNIEEVEEVHRKMLLLAVEETNKEYRALLLEKDKEEATRQRNNQQQEKQRKQIKKVAKRIKF